jgi:hypothetical protein
VKKKKSNTLKEAKHNVLFYGLYLIASLNYEVDCFQNNVSNEIFWHKKAYGVYQTLVCEVVLE